MENNGLKISRGNTEHLKQQGTLIRLGCRYARRQKLSTCQQSVLQISWINAIKDVECRVAEAWSKWTELNGVMICDKKIPTKLKILIHQTVIRPTSLYGCETWPMSVKYEKRVATTEMKIVQWG